MGVSGMVIEKRESVEYHGEKHFPMQSVYKLPIAISVLHAVENGRVRLDQPVRVTENDMVPAALVSPLRDKHPQGGEFTVEDLLRRAIVDSDGSASDILLRVMGGTKQIRRYLKRENIRGVHVLHTEAQLAEDKQRQYGDSAKPDAMVDLLARLQTGKLLNTEDTERLLNWMKESRTGKDRIRGKLPSGTDVADKTGGSGTYDGLTPATNDVGLIELPDGNHVAIAIFLSDSRAGVTERNAAIADVTRVVWDCWAEAGQ